MICKCKHASERHNDLGECSDCECSDGMRRPRPPAPMRVPRAEPHHYASEMTKREAMAVAALAGLLGGRELGGKAAARLAVEIADALLEELAK